MTSAAQGDIAAVAFEKALAVAVETEDEEHIAHVLRGIDRTALEFTGRCYASAMRRGLTRTTVLFAENGFHLNVADEPAAKRLLGDGGNPHALFGFFDRYAYCRPQKEYWLAVVDSGKSLEPVRALLERGVGLTDEDKANMLALAIQYDKVPLARLLAAFGVSPAQVAGDALPASLAAAGCGRNPWVEAASPHHEAAMLRFLLEQVEGDVFPIRRYWFALHFRERHFAERLALIALRSSSDLCEDPASTVRVLAAAGQIAALSRVLSWESVRACDLSGALDAARESGNAEAAALVLEAMRGESAGEGALSGVRPLDW